MAEAVFQQWLAQRRPDAATDINSIRSSATRFALKRLDNADQVRAAGQMALDMFRPERTNRGRAAAWAHVPATPQNVAQQWLEGNAGGASTSNVRRAARNFALRRGLSDVEATEMVGYVIHALHNPPAAPPPAKAPPAKAPAAPPPAKAPAAPPPAKAPPAKAPAPQPPPKAPAAPPPVAEAKAPAPPPPAKAPAPGSVVTPPAQHKAPPPEPNVGLPPHQREARAGSSNDPAPNTQVAAPREAIIADKEDEEPIDLDGADAEKSILETVSKEHNYPTARKLHQLLHQKGIRIIREQVQEFVRNQNFRERHKPRHLPDNEGKRWSWKDSHPIKSGVWNLGRPRTRWFLDIATYRKNETSNGHRHILVAQDGFSRRLFARPLLSTDGPEVARALSEILDEAKTMPGHIVSDNGPDMKNPEVRALLQRKDIYHEFKEKGDYNVTSQLDNAIRSLKRAIALHQDGEPGFQWSQHLQQIVDGENSIPRHHLLDATSKEVDKFGSDQPTTVREADIGFSLEKAAAERLRLGDANITQREERLKRVGQFDARLPPERSAFQRGHHARWDPKRQVQSVEGNLIIDSEGASHQARRVRIAPGGGDERAQAERYRELVLGWLRNRPQGKAKASDIATFLRQHDLGPRPRIERLAQLLGLRHWKEGPHVYIEIA